jgi:hypothetical protein
LGPKLLGAMKAPPLAMHRVSSARSSRSDFAAVEPKAGPIDFLARLEMVERQEGASAAPQQQKSVAAPFKPSRRPSVNDGGVGADKVMDQLRAVEQELDELRHRKRESTPPEKRVGTNPSSLGL